MSPQDPLSIPAVLRKWRMDIGTIVIFLIGAVILSLLSLYFLRSWGVLVAVIVIWTFLKGLSVENDGDTQERPDVVLFDPGVRKLFPAIWQATDSHARAVGIPKPELVLLKKTDSSACSWVDPSPGVGLRSDLAALPPNQVSAVLAHEIAHLKNRDVRMVDVIRASYAAFLASLRWFFLGSCLQLMIGYLSQSPHQPSLSAVLLFAYGIFAVRILIDRFCFHVWFPKILRQHEYAADALGSVITGDPISLVMALAATQALDDGLPAEVEDEDEDEPLGPQTYPSLHDRITALMLLAQQMRDDQTP